MRAVRTKHFFLRMIKNLIRKSYVSLIVIVISTLLITIYYFFSFHTPAGNQSGVVELYFADNISAAHAKVIEQFNKKYENRIKVVPIDLPFAKFSTNERKELLARSLRSKSESIDVFAVDLIWVPRFTKWCEPLDRYFAKTELTPFLSYALESCIHEGQLTAVPLYLDISLLYYREDILKDLSVNSSLLQSLNDSLTWEDFINIHSQLKPNSYPYYIFPADDYEGLICSYFELILNKDKNFFKKDLLQFNNQIGKSSLQLLVDLVNRYNLSPRAITRFKENNCYEYFLNNDGLFLRGWPSFEKDYKNLVHDPSKEIHVKKTMLPYWGNNPGSVYGGWNLMISKFTNHKTEAIEFINYVTSEEAQEILYNEGSYLPVKNIFYESSEYLEKYPDLVFMKKLLDRGLHRPFMEDYTRISDIVSYYVNRAIENQISISKALEEIDEMILNNKVIIK